MNNRGGLPPGSALKGFGGRNSRKLLSAERTIALEPAAVKDRSDLKRVVFDQTRVILVRDLSIMNPNLVPGAQGLVVGKLAKRYSSLKVQ